MAYRVYFGRLPESLTQDDFEKMLEEHGKAKNIDWKSGYAYVDYKHGSDASKTVQNLNGKEVGGNNILVELAQNGAGGYAVAFASRPFPKPPQPRPVRTPHRVRIENLSSRAKWMELKELLSLAGDVTFADTHKRKTGEGIVEFATRKDMDEAIKTFHNTTFFGKTIKLYDESPRSRSRSPRGPKSRSHSSRHSSERKRTRSNSASPRRRSSPSRKRSTSPRKRSQRRSRSGDRKSRRKHSRSRTPTKSSRNSHKKSKKSKRGPSRSRSKSPRHKCNRSSSDNNNEGKSKTKKRHSSSSSSDSDNKSK